MLLVTGLLLLYAALLRLADLLGANFFAPADTGARSVFIWGAFPPGAMTWTSLVLAGVAGWAAFSLRSAVALLIGAIAGGIGVLAAIAFVFDADSQGPYRVAALVLAIALAVGSLALRGSAPRHAQQLVNAAGLAILVIPVVSSLSDDVINAVPQSLRDGSYGLGATKSETILKVILPAAMPGIVGALLLAVSRAVGETMIVVMAAGLTANLTGNPFAAVTTVTVQIVTLLVGDQEFDSPKTLAAFALGLVLFVMTLCLNIVALRIVRRYREQYE